MITTTISLFCNNSVIASSTVKGDPADLLKCYAKIMTNPCIYEIFVKVEPDIDYAFSKGIFMENGEYTIMGGIDTDWMSQDDWSSVEDNDINRVVDWVIRKINSMIRALA